MWIRWLVREIGRSQASRQFSGTQGHGQLQIREPGLYISMLVSKLVNLIGPPLLSPYCIRTRSRFPLSLTVVCTVTRGKS